MAQALGWMLPTELPTSNDHADSRISMYERNVLNSCEQDVSGSASLWERTDQPARHDMDGFQAA
jgi:hypothetical protein